MRAKPKSSPRAKPPLPSPSQKRPFPPWALIGLILGATLLAYLPVLKHGFFVEWDDPDYVTSNPHVQAGLTAASVAWAFRATEFANWFPLTWLSHMLDCQFYGLNPIGHHLTSLLFHLANTLLLFLVLRKLTRATWPSCLVSGLFALHPMHVESVAWIAERKDVLSAFFFLLTLWCYGAYVAATARDAKTSPQTAARPGFPAPVLYAITLVCFALGLMAKPMLVSLPLVLLLLDYWPLRRVAEAQPLWFKSWLPLVLEKLPFFLLSIASSIITFLAQAKAGTVAAVVTVPLFARVANVIVSYASYVVKAVIPSRLSPLYRFDFHLPAWQVGGSALLLAAITALVFGNAKRRPYLVTGWLWYGLMLLPVIGLVQVGGQAMADRYTYLPLIGIFIMAAWALEDLSVALTAKRTSGAQRLAVGAAAVLLGLGVTTREYTRYWRDSFTLFSRALSLDDLNDTAHFNVGLWLATRENKFQEAAEHFQRASQLNPHQAAARYSLGLCMARLGDRTNAVAAYREALQADPAYGAAHHNLAIILEQEGNRAEAFEHYTSALKSNPNNAQVRKDFANAHNNFGAALMQQGKLKEAESEFLAAANLDPAHPLAQCNLALVLFDEGRYPEAWKAVHACRENGGVPSASFLTNLSARLPEPPK